MEGVEECSVVILMATYNGEKYISEQIESIRNQSYNNWKLFIADDCSTDNTNSIITNYSLLDNRINLHINRKRKGPCQNFAELLYTHLEDAKYFMFSDQDDVWHNDKIEKSISLIKKTTNDMPTLFFCRKRIVDEQLNVIGNDSHNINYSLADILCQNHIYGCTMIMNKSLAKCVTPVPAYATNHDYWIALVAAFYGKIVMIDECLMDYRIHKGNVTGGINQYGIMNKLKSWRKTNLNLREKYRMCYMFADKYNNYVTDSYKNVFDVKGLRRIYRANKFGYRTDSYLGTFREYLIILFVCIEEFRENGKV